MDQEIRLCTSADGVRLAYAGVGDGPPLVKAANYLTHLEFDWQSPVWKHWLTGLSEEHRLVRYDERGCGLSDWDVDEFSLDAWVRDLETVVDAADLERFALLGISQGGAVATSFAARHPERVSHLVLYGAYARGRLVRAGDESEIRRAELLLELMNSGWGQDNPAFRQVFTSLFMPEATLAQMEWFNELQRITTSPENAVRFEEAFFRIDVSDVARDVSSPTLVLHGRDDAMVPFDEGQRLAALIPSSEFVPLQSRNHILLEDEPAWEQFLTRLRRFLAAEPPLQDQRPVGELRRLTPREREVLDFIARGMSNAEIAEHLVISPHTLRNHISNVFAKLGVRDRAQAIVVARESGLGQSAHRLR